MKIYCKECNKIISSESDSCPHCGKKNNYTDYDIYLSNKKYKDFTKLLFIISFLFFLVCLFFLIFGLSNNSFFRFIDGFLHK